MIWLLIKKPPIEQIADKYDQMNPKINAENTDAGLCGALEQIMQRQICLAQIRSTWKWYRISAVRETAIFTDSWNYVLNKASKNKDAAVKFLQYMADEGGMEASYKAFDRYPARKDVAEKVLRILTRQKKCTADMQMNAMYRDVRWWHRQWNLSPIWERSSSPV